MGEVGGGGTGVTPCCMHEVTACIYIQGDEKPTLKWPFVNKNRREGYFCFFVTWNRAVSAKSGLWRNQNFHVAGYFPSTPARSDQFRMALPLLQDEPQLIGKFRCE